MMLQHLNADLDHDDLEDLAGAGAIPDCADLEAVEDLAFGRLGAEAARAAESHLAACAVCRAEYAMFVAENDLFARRAELSAPPVVSGDAVVEAVLGDRDQASRWESRFNGVARVVLAVAACVAAFVGSQWLVRAGSASWDHPGPSPAASADPSGDPMSLGITGDDALACAFPMSQASLRSGASSSSDLAFSGLSSSGTGDPFCSSSGDVHRGAASYATRTSSICEDVTSSVATP